MQFRRLKDLREDADKTQSEVAAYLHIQQNTYSQYENGRRQIPIWVLIRLAVYYRTSTDYILGLSPIRQNAFILSDLHLTETACEKLARKEISGDTLSRLMEHKDFGRLMRSMGAYLNDTYLEGVTFRNDMLKLGAMFARDHADEFENSGDVRLAANTALVGRTGAHELEITDIQNLTMRILKETKATVEEEKLAANPVLRKFANQEFEAKLRTIMEQAKAIKDTDERLDFVVDQTLEAVRQQTGVKAFFLKPFKPLFRKIIKKTGAPETEIFEETSAEE